MSTGNLSRSSIQCLDLATGNSRWEKPLGIKNVKTTTFHSPTVLLHEKIAYIAINRTLRAFDTAGGEELWAAPCADAGYRMPASIFILNGLIWDVDATGEPYRSETVYEPMQVNRKFVGYDLRTGEVRKELPLYGEQGYGVMHHRCHIPRASGDYILTGFPGIEFVDTSNGDVQHHSWIRGACVYGFLPANGLIYAPPHPCACYMEGKLTGFLAVAPERDNADPTPAHESPRQRKGPAFGKVEEAGSPDTESWPTYRGDVARSGTYAGELPSSLSEAWKTPLGGRLTQAVASEGRLFTVARDSRQLFALDAESGEVLWSRQLAGRVDSAPTCYRGMVLFGCHDGYVYSLRASDGRLVWRFRAAREDRRLVAYDQLESLWPVHGSVLIQDDILWFVAGRSSFLDGGLFVYRLNPESGKQLSMTRVLLLNPDGTQPPLRADAIQPTDIGGRAATRLDMAGAKPDVLSSNGERVFMRHYAFDMNGKSVDQRTDHLFSPTGFLDESWFRRTYWVYGTHFVGGAQGWAWAGNTRPSGRIMSIGAEFLCGFGRDMYPPSPGNNHQMYAAGEREVLFSISKDHRLEKPAAIKARRTPDAGHNKNLHGDHQWSQTIGLQVRAMLLANRDKTLFLAGAKGDWILSKEAYDGKLGSTLRVVSTRDGETISHHELTAPIVFDGMSAAAGRLYLALEDGSIACFSEP